MAEQPIALLPFYQGWVCLSGCLRSDPATDHLRDDPRGERSAEDHLHPILQGEGPAEGQRSLLVCAKG